MNKKGFANILIIILAVVIIAGVAGYFLLNRNVKDKPQPITSTNSKNNSLPAGGAAGRGDDM
jgi:flagellar basal body-associated protein FliL